MIDGCVFVVGGQTCVCEGDCGACNGVCEPRLIVRMIGEGCIRVEMLKRGLGERQLAMMAGMYTAVSMTKIQRNPHIQLLASHTHVHTYISRLDDTRRSDTHVHTWCVIQICTHIYRRIHRCTPTYPHLRPGGKTLKYNDTLISNTHT